MTIKEKLIKNIQELPEEAIKEILEFVLVVKKRVSSKSEDDENNVWKILRESNIEAEEDSSIEHDHYIHGTPKLYS